MLRRFAAHDRRPVTDLRGVWDFAFLADAEIDHVDVAAIRFDDLMAVPGCFDATPRYAGRRGLAAYRTAVHLPAGRTCRLILDGVHHVSRVFVGGKKLADHSGGFTRFAVDVPPGDGGPAELVLLVDNRVDYARCPLHLDYYDWYHYGGIARGAELHVLGDPHIDAMRVITENLDARRIRVIVDYTATKAVLVPFAVTFDGKELESGEVKLAAPAGRIERTYEIPGAALWSPDDPNLHLLYVTLGDDDLRERIGIRQVRVAGRDLLINDKSVRLLGFNRHEAHPAFGCAIGEHLHVSDLHLIKDMGGNFIRGSHYPQDGRFLDLCDEMGVLVWSEPTGWNNTPDQATDERFIAAQMLQVDEMVAAAVNHPSVILWGILNEGPSDSAAARPLYEKMFARLKELDPTRPVTYASNKVFRDVCMDLADVISLNLYPGWYNGPIGEIPAFLQKVYDHYDGQDDSRGKPMIVSEIGGGAIYGWRDAHGARWSEQYQARLLETVIRSLFVDADRVCGIAIWQFCDCRTAENVDRAMKRPRCFNNKGVVDECRRPKMAYDAVKRMFQELR